VRRRRFPILFWSTIVLGSAFVATAAAIVVVSIVRSDSRGVIALIYAAVFFGGILFLAVPLLLLADMAVSRLRHGSWPWKQPVPRRPDG
jgi:hypothetical protein